MGRLARKRRVDQRVRKFIRDIKPAPQPLFQVGQEAVINCPLKEKAHGQRTTIKSVDNSFGSGFAYWCEGKTGAGFWHESFLKPISGRQDPT